MFRRLQWLLLKRFIVKKNNKHFYSSIKSSAINCTFSEYDSLLGGYLTNVNMGRFSYIAGGYIANCDIGAFCSIAPGVRIGMGTHPSNFLSTSPVFFSTKGQLPISFAEKDYFTKEIERITIGNDVWIGANVTILDGVHIGDGAIVGAGAVVTKDVEPYSIVGGVPAKKIRMRFTDVQIKKIEELKWWTWSVEKLKENAMYFQQEASTEIINEFINKNGSV